MRGRIKSSVAVGTMVLALLLLGMPRADSFMLGQRQTVDSIPARPQYLKRRHPLSQSIQIVRQSRDNEAFTISKTPDVLKGKGDSDIEALSTTKESTRDLGESIPGIGLIVLCSVPLVWGTYVPIVRLLYEIDPPIPGFLFSALYFFISSVTTISLSNILDNNRGEETETLSIEDTSAKDKEGLLAGLELGSWVSANLCSPRRLVPCL